jgi:serine phosphatase RsbU (regulator of sigma subunit)
VRRDGRTEIVSDAGGLLGLVPWSPPPVVQISLHEGDSIVLYTDGITDVAGGGAVDAGELAALVAGLAGSSPDEMAEEVRLELERRRPLHQRSDDVALLIARASRSGRSGLT